jgi:hypothetical protein
MVELTSVLVSGQLKIDFIKDGHSQFSAIQFHAVMEKLEIMFPSDHEQELSKLLDEAGA